MKGILELIYVEVELVVEPLNPKVESRPHRLRVELQNHATES